MKKEWEWLLSDASKGLDNKAQRTSFYREISEEFIRLHKDKLDWEMISAYSKLSNEFMIEFEESLHFHYVWVYQKVSEDFIRRHIFKAQWETICLHQELSEDFILEFSNSMNWKSVAKYQPISVKFIVEHCDKISINDVLAYNNNIKLDELLKDENVAMFKLLDDSFDTEIIRLGKIKKPLRKRPLR